jgi:PAS domain S-box-containing protein
MTEELRLNAVKQFDQLNLKNDTELNYTINLAAELCNTPISFISIIDADTQWIKVGKGIELEKVDLESSICRHTIKRNRLFIVKDTWKDRRFKHYPNVKDGMKMRFHASFPLITMEGYRVGTLCVMDVKPHELTDKQKASLKLLSKHATSLMELRLSLSQLDQSFLDIRQIRENKSDNEIKLRSMFESLTDSYYLIGKEGEIIDFNRTAYNFGVSMFERKLSQGAMINDFLTKPYIDSFNTHFQRALNGNKVQLDRQADFGEKGKIWWECIFEPVRNDSGEIIGISYVARNIDERKANEEKILSQNKALIRIGEIQAHDYRGPLTTILGLLYLIEIENYAATEEYVIMLKTAANELDKKIRDVIKIVEANP